MALTNDHPNFIHTIHWDGKDYEVHDKLAIHSLADLAELGLSTEGFFVYKGIKASVAELPAKEENVKGDVWHVTDANGEHPNSEYVWTGEEWEEFGHHITVNHTHTVEVAGTNEPSAVTGDVVVTGGNTASAVTGSASVVVPTISDSAVYAKIDSSNDTFVKSYSGATSKLATTSVTAAGAATEVVASVSPTTGSIIGVNGSTTASKATAGTAVEVAKVGETKTVITALTDGSVVPGGSTSTTAYDAKVENGVLTFSPISVINSVTHTAVTLPTVGDTVKVTSAISGGSITPYTFADVTVPVAAAATTVVTGVSTTDASVATVGAAVTVATGSLSANGEGAAVMTGLGTADTGSALTAANLAAGSDSDFYTGDIVTINSETVTGTVEGTAAPQIWTQNTGAIENGEAAAQVWTQTSGSTGAPVEA